MRHHHRGTTPPIETISRKKTEFSRALHGTEKHGLLWSGLRFLVKSAGRFRSGLHSTTYFFPNCEISHAFSFFRHAFTASYLVFYISTSIVSSTTASCCVDCPSWTHWLRLSCCAAMAALYFEPPVGIPGSTSGT